MDAQNTQTVLLMIGIFITNLTIILAAWIKVKTDITAINVMLKGIDIRVIEIESNHKNDLQRINERIDKFTDNNDIQHEGISDKIDNLKDTVNNFKVEVIKQLK